VSGFVDLFEKYKMVRRLALLWALALITYATHAMFADIGAITGPAAGAYATVTALLTAVIGLYQWQRHADDK